MNRPIDGAYGRMFAHGNLAIYFLRGTSRSGPVPLTLQEAMAKKVVEVRETDQVNELQAENKSDEEVFVQAGDIVKGGKQDRVLSVSLVLPPHSAAIPIASFCVESGRWSARGGEDSYFFSSADIMLPSLQAKLEMAARQGSRREGAGPVPVSTQQRIWGTVSHIQRQLSNVLETTVAAPQSQTSLQLSLENVRLERKQTEYMAALQARGEQENDIRGYVFAVTSGSQLC